MIVNTSAAVGDGSSGGLAVYNPEQEQVASGDLPESSGKTIENTTETEDAIVEPTVEPKAFDEHRFWREIELIARLGELKLERDDIEIELSDAKRDAKGLRDSLSEANELVGDLESQLTDKTDEFMSAAFELCNVARGAIEAMPVKVESVEGELAKPAAADEPNDGWRSHSTKDLLSCGKGNKGKRDSVAELAPTVGHLEDLRAESSKECVSFSEKLPKGCGKGFAQSIEDLLIEFISKWVTQQSNPAAAKQADELVADVRESAKQNDWKREDCQPKDTDSAAMRAGFTAFGEGRPYSDVVQDDLHVAKQWLTGWVSGEVLKTLAE